MADFNSWSKESLVKFAEDATGEIARLQEDLRNMHVAWRQALHAHAADATVAHDPVDPRFVPVGPPGG